MNRGMFPIMPGPAGDSAYLYIGYADDASGNGFSLAFLDSKDYIAVLSTDTELTPPVVGDFAGLWKRYKGDPGTDGPSGADTQYPIVSNNVSDADHDLDFAACRVRSDDTAIEDRVWITVPAITKRFDATWSVGSGNGGLDTGSLANNTWYSVWTIMRTDTGVTDVVATVGNGPPNLPANYDKKARVFDFLTNGSANILAFGNVDDAVIFTDFIVNLNTTTPSTSGESLRLSTPARHVEAFVVVGITDTSNGDWFGVAHGTGVTPSLRSGVIVMAVANVFRQDQGTVFTDASGQVVQIGNNTPMTTAYVATPGWRYLRGQR